LNSPSGGIKENVAFTFKFAQKNTLLEFDVFHLNQFAMSGTILHFKEDFIIKIKLQFRHTRQKIRM
jgi:hypothetical protein